MNTAAAKAGQRKRLRLLGLIEKHVWVHPLDWPAVKALVDRLGKRRGR